MWLLPWKKRVWRRKTSKQRNEPSAARGSLERNKTNTHAKIRNTMKESNASRRVANGEESSFAGSKLFFHKVRSDDQRVHPGTEKRANGVRRRVYDSFS